MLPAYQIDANPFGQSMRYAGESVRNALMAYGQNRQKEQEQASLLQSLSGLGVKNAESLSRTPEVARNVLAQYMDPMLGLRKSQAESDLSMAPLRRQQMQNELDMNPLRRLQLEAQTDASRTSTSMQNQQLNTARQVAPYEIEMKRLAAAGAQRDFAAPKDTLRTVKEGEQLIQVDPRTGSVTPVFDGRGGDGAQTKEFRSASAKQMAELYQEHVKDGQKAIVAKADLDRLEQLAGVVGSGKWEAVKPTIGPWLQSIGIDTKGLSDAQAFQAIVNKMGPAMRPTGSGATSDRDMQIYMASLPQLSQTPEGRKMVLNQMRAMHEYSRQRSAIASQALSGRMSPGQAEDLIAKLPDPFQMFKSATGAANQAPSQTRSIPPAAVQMLRGNPTPQTMKQFDEIFGPGAAQSAIGGR